MRLAMSCSTCANTQTVTATIGLRDNCSFPACILTKEHALCRYQVTVHGRVESKQALERNPNKSAELVQTPVSWHGLPIWRASYRRLPTLNSLADRTNVLLRSCRTFTLWGKSGVYIGATLVYRKDAVYKDVP